MAPPTPRTIAVLRQRQLLEHLLRARFRNNAYRDSLSSRARRILVGGWVLFLVQDRRTKAREIEIRVSRRGTDQMMHCVLERSLFPSDLCQLYNLRTTRIGKTITAKED